MLELSALWLFSYLLHSTLLLSAVLLLERIGLLRRLASRESAWRLALFGGLVSASLQAAAPLLKEAWQASGAETIAAPVAAKQTPPSTVGRPAQSIAAPSTQAAAPPGHPDRAVAGTAPVAGKTGPRLPLPKAWQSTLETAALVLWALLAFGIGRYLWQLRRLHQRVAALPACEDAALKNTAAELAAQAGVAAPALRLAPDWLSPVVAPPATVCLPAWTLRDLDGTQQRALLAHELAHLHRRDPQWLHAATLVDRLFWFQPLNHVARRRLETLAEHAADAWAAAHCGDGRPLAESLLRCAEQLQRQYSRGKPLQTDLTPALAIAMARPQSPLLTRLQALLEDTPMPISKKPLWLVGGVAVAVLAVLVALPAFSFNQSTGTSISIHQSMRGDGPNMKAEIDTADRDLSLEFKGRIVFNDNESDVQSLAKTATIEDEFQGITRKIVFTPKGNNGVEREYRVNGKTHAFDADAQRWLAEVIPFLLRETGYDAEARVGRLFAKGGADAVLAETAHMRHDHGRRSYLETLLKITTLTPDAVNKVLAAVTTIDSDYDQRSVLEALIAQQALDEAQQTQLLQNLKRLGSDYEKRIVLVSLTQKLSSQPDVVAAWKNAVAAIGSDYETRTVLETLAERGDLSEPLLIAALDVAAHIGSDYELRSALAAFAKTLADKPEALKHALQSAQKISSDYERREALTTLMQHTGLDVAAALLVLDLAQNISSDYEKTEVLTALAAKMPKDDTLLTRYRSVARSLSDYERGQAEKALDRFAD